MPEASFGIHHLWQQSDFVIKTVAAFLFIMSVASWSIIVIRAIRQWRHRTTSGTIDSFWRAHSFDEGKHCLERLPADSPFTGLLEQARAAADHAQNHTNSLGASLNGDEFVVRTMRKSIALSTARLESGMTILASVGSTAPFIGLFGTVWGIYGALINISVSGAATLDKVAGPVGEALIMTAFGLFVAIPAVLAYNTFARFNRLELSELDAFAHDLHAWFCTGSRVNANEQPRIVSHQRKQQPMQASPGAA